MSEPADAAKGPERVCSPIAQLEHKNSAGGGGALSRDGMIAGSFYAGV